MVAIELDRDHFDKARVLHRTITYLRSNILNRTILAILLAGLPGVVFGLLCAITISHNSSQINGVGALLLKFVFSLIPTFLASVFQAAIIKNSIEPRTDSIWKMLSDGFPYVLPLFGLAILLQIAIGFGLILLIVPGVIFAIKWSVSTPALVIEDTGVFGSASRSADLTKGFRWEIFLLFLIYGLGSAVIYAVFLAPFGFGLKPMREDVLTPALMMNDIIDGVLSTIFTPISTFLAVSIYAELRTIKEGVGSSGVAQVFD